MKSIYPLTTLLCLVFCLCSCHKRTGFELKAELTGFSPDMLLVVYDDPESKTDTIYPKEGKFTYNIQADTLSTFRLVNDSGQYIPFFAYNGWRAVLKGSFKDYTIEGNGANEEFQNFRNQISGTEDFTRIQQAAESFIRSHPQSFVSAYLINEYFVQTKNPDEAKIESLIQPLDGDIKDSRILSVVLKSIPDNKGKKNTNVEYVNYYSAKTRAGKYVSWNSNKGQLTLINFWATWNTESVERCDSLYKLTKEFGKKELRVLNISLDYNKQLWEKSCKEDTEQWIEICDTKGWDNQIVKQMNLLDIPANILVNGSRKIQGRNLYGDALRKRVEELAEEKKK